MLNQEEPTCIDDFELENKPEVVLKEIAQKKHAHESSKLFPLSDYVYMPEPESHRWYVGVVDANLKLYYQKRLDYSYLPAMKKELRQLYPISRRVYIENIKEFLWAHYKDENRNHRMDADPQFVCMLDQLDIIPTRYGLYLVISCDEPVESAVQQYGKEIQFYVRKYLYDEIQKIKNHQED